MTAYDVIVWKARPNGKVVRYRTHLLGPNARHLKLTLPVGRYKFAVAAENVAGTGPRSARTPFVRPR